MDSVQQYVQADANGVMRVGGTHVMLDSVIASFDQGHSPESIRSQYPTLTLEQIYGTITYYLAHRDEVESYLRRQDAEWAKWQSIAEQRQGGVVDRLRRLKPLGTAEITR